MTPTIGAAGEAGKGFAVVANDVKELAKEGRRWRTRTSCGGWRGSRVTPQVR